MSERNKVTHFKTSTNTSANFQLRAPARPGGQSARSLRTAQRLVLSDAYKRASTPNGYSLLPTPQTAGSPFQTPQEHPRENTSHSPLQILELGLKVEQARARSTCPQAFPKRFTSLGPFVAFSTVFHIFYSWSFAPRRLEVLKSGLLDCVAP
jgi:hypothetical protein